MLDGTLSPGQPTSDGSTVSPASDAVADTSPSTDAIEPVDRTEVDVAPGADATPVDSSHPDAGGEAPPPQDSGVNCSPLASCGGAGCTNLNTDPNNCGACAHVCGAAMPTCLNGACVLTCGAMTNCNNACVNEQADPANCGACGAACGTGVACTAGACTCPVGQAYCNGSCIPDQSDPNNCGGCGVTCVTANGFACSSGACACTTGLTQCGSGCVDLTTDNSHCGGCNNQCGSGTTCESGTCQCYGGMRCNSACTRTLSDPNNCGACGNVCLADSGTPTCDNGTCGVSCTSPLVNCGGACVDTTSDPVNCGGCGMQCPNGANCANGVCGCAAGLTQCGAACTDTQTDNANCGACGLACGMGTTCTAGACVPGCGTGELTLCTGPGPRGMMVSTCVNLETDARNCGACGTACPIGAPCNNGTCGCLKGETQCAGGFRGTGLCVDLTSNTNNCGACGMQCAASSPVCAQSTCVVQCVAPTTECAGGVGGGGGGGSSCVNLQTNKNNCGFCNESCGGNLTCSGGACVCAAPYVNCSGTCTNLASDGNNCGACGTTCAGASTCQSGACQ